MKFDHDPEERWLEYKELTRSQKRQVVAFINVVFDMEKAYG